MKWIWIYFLCGQEVWSEPSMGARMVPANGQTTKTKKIFYMSFWLERLSILLQIYTFACNFCSRKGGRASIGYRASIGTYTVYYIRYTDFVSKPSRWTTPLSSNRSSVWPWCGLAPFSSPLECWELAGELLRLWLAVTLLSVTLPSNTAPESWSESVSKLKHQQSKDSR